MMSEGTKVTPALLATGKPGKHPTAKHPTASVEGTGKTATASSSSSSSDGDGKKKEIVIPPKKKGIVLKKRETKESGGQGKEGSISFNFSKPKKCIKSPLDLTRFKSSSAYAKLLNFINTVSSEIRGVGLSNVSIEAAPTSIKALFKALEQMEGWLEDFPPIQQPMRFGNKAFRQWYARVEEKIGSMMAGIVGKQWEEKGASEELKTYLMSSFGNPTRIDYGTGHELNFLAFLVCLSELRLIDAGKNARSIALLAFQRYIGLMRKLQTQYWLEPAGSKGVWGVDDYNFLPLLWGAAQHSSERSQAQNQLSKLQQGEDLKTESMYFQAVSFVCKVKTGALAEHSPILNDISAVPTWKKVNKGLVKM